jgi:uncharacterized SAM-binding protein YcdF (DUF218 family)
VLRRALVLLVVLVAAWVAASLVFFTWSPWDGAAPRHADAVVVLSGDRDRLPRALALIRDGVAPVLAISSVAETPNFRLARRLCSAGRYASARVLCFEAVPYSTRGESETVAHIAARKRWTHLVVVTSNYHITRAHMLFRRCFAGRLTMISSPTSWWKLPVDWADETAKITYQLTAQRSC